MNKQVNRCSSCQASWAEGNFHPDCLECGGFAMTRTCPHCDGKCGALWHREVNMSHAYKEAFYSGGCKLRLRDKPESGKTH